MSWNYDSKNKEVIFILEVKATGWIGLGISDVNSSMHQMDIVVAWVDSNGQNHIKVCFTAHLVTQQTNYRRATDRKTSNDKQPMNYRPPCDQSISTILRNHFNTANKLPICFRQATETFPIIFRNASDKVMFPLPFFTGLLR